MSQHREAFPDHAVKQALREYNLERGDDHIVISLQNELLSRTLFSILKGAVIHAIKHNHRFIGERDLLFGRKMGLLEGRRGPSDAGMLLDSDAFALVVEDHIRMWSYLIEKFSSIEVEKLRISSEALESLQMHTESVIRHFLYNMSLRCANKSVNVKHFDSYMMEFIGDPSYSENLDGYSSYEK